MAIDTLAVATMGWITSGGGGSGTVVVDASSITLADELVGLGVQDHETVVLGTDPVFTVEAGGLVLDASAVVVLDIQQE